MRKETATIDPATALEADQATDQASAIDSDTAAEAKPVEGEITLAVPIKRAGGDIAKVVLRKPKAGELRGLKVEDLFNTDVAALVTLLPRISSPALIPAEVEALELEDLLEVAGTVKGFFMSAELKAAIAKMAG